MLAFDLYKAYNPSTKGVTLVNRDGVKTVIGLLVIGLIIVATFLYGNHQRQAQLRHDQDVKKQEQTAVKANPQTTPVPQTSTQPQPGVPSPAANAIQGQGKPTVNVPATGGSTLSTQASTPRTGAGDWAPVALLAVLGSGIYYRRSQQQLLTALIRTERSQPLPKR